MAGVMSNIYNAIIKRNTIFLGTIFVSAFATEILFDTGANKIWDGINRGRQWKDIKHRYIDNHGDEEEAEEE